jgi:hypothetical protein
VRRLRRWWTWKRAVVGAVVLSGAGAGLWLYWPSVALRWHLLPGWIARADLYCSDGTTQVTSPLLVERLRAAAVEGSGECNYPTRCLSDTPQNWRLVFSDRLGRPFEVQLAVDDCGVFYCPSLGWTYGDVGALEELARQIAAQAGLKPPVG